MTNRRGFVRPVATVLAVLGVLYPCGTVTARLHLTASTVLVMGGSLNPAGLTPVMQQELGGDPFHPGRNLNPLTPVGVFGEGYIDTANNPDSPFAGWDLSLIEWPAQISVPLFGMYSYGGSQRQGLAAFDSALAAVLPTLGEGERVTAFGYSSSANVMVRAMRALQDQGAPAADRLEFILLGNPNRPNGGLLQRFAGLHIPVLDVDFDGTTPLDTPYPTLDISWEYDTVADFPTYPLNLLAVLNSLVGGMLVHGNYFRADIDGPRAFPDTTVGNITYITLEPPHLPLLMPLYDLGFPGQLLDLVEPALTAMVDLGYDRTVGPGTPTTARFLPDSGNRAEGLVGAATSREQNRVRPHPDRTTQSGKSTRPTVDRRGPTTTAARRGITPAVPSRFRPPRPPSPHRAR